MSAHLRPGAGLSALLSLLAVTTATPPAHAQAATHKWSTYLGGSGTDRVTAIVQQPSNNDVVVAGFTNSRDFPTRGGTGVDTASDAFLAVLTQTGNVRGSAFIFGGSTEDTINAMALGDQGQIYVVGTTQTANMPGITTRYFSHAGAKDAFLARFTSGGVPEWIMYLGSAGDDIASGVRVSGTNIYVTGSTTSCAFRGNTGSCQGGKEGFVVKISNPTGPAPGLEWTTIITGNGDDSLSRSRIDGADLLVTGSTASTTMGHSPVIGSFQGGGTDALVAKLSTATGAVGWVEYWGGPGEDSGFEALPAGPGETVVVGTTGTALKKKNIFATWMSSAGAVLRTQTFGGSEDDTVSSATVDETGTLYIGGQTRSTDLPLSYPFDSSTELAIPPYEGFVLTVPLRGGPGWFSYVGGNDRDDVVAMSILGNRLILGGDTTSSADLVSGGAYPTRSSPPDGFLFAADTDITPPLAEAVHDTVDNDPEAPDIATQLSTSSLSANWSFSDPESGVDRYEYAFGTAPGAQDVLPFTWTMFSNQTSATKTDLILEIGKTYYATVRAINGAGNTVTLSSNGVTVVPVVTDGGTSGPDAGTSNPDGGTPDGGSNEQPEDGSEPLMGWSCSAADASLPVVLGLLALVLVARRRTTGRG